MKINTIEQAENACKDLEGFYILYIKQAIEDAGGLRRLADKINFDPGNLSNVLSKNKFSALRRLAVRIYSSIPESEN